MTSPQAPEGTSEPSGADSDIQVPPDPESPSESDSSSDTFSRYYVSALREESRQHRLKAQRVDFVLTEVRRLATREACRGVLADPDALSWSDDFEGEDGLPDHDRLKAAAEAMALERPWLARVRGPLPGQGEHGTTEPALSLSELLRA